MADLVYDNGAYRAQNGTIKEVNLKGETQMAKDNGYKNVGGFVVTYKDGRQEFIVTSTEKTPNGVAVPIDITITGDIEKFSPALAPDSGKKSPGALVAGQTYEIRKIDGINQIIGSDGQIVKTDNGVGIVSSDSSLNRGGEDAGKLFRPAPGANLQGQQEDKTSQTIVGGTNDKDFNDYTVNIKDTTNASYTQVLVNSSERILTAQEVTTETRKIEQQLVETKKVEQNFKETQVTQATSTQTPDIYIPPSLEIDPETGKIRQVPNPAGVQVDSKGNIVGTIMQPLTNIENDQFSASVGLTGFVNTGAAALGKARAGLGVVGELATPAAYIDEKTGEVKPNDTQFGLRGSVQLAIGEFSQTNTTSYNQQGTASTNVTLTEEQQRNITNSTTSRETTTSSTPTTINQTTVNGVVTNSETITGQTNNQVTVQQLAQSQQVGDWNTTKATKTSGATTTTWDAATVTGRDSQLNTGARIVADAQLFFGNQNMQAVNPNQTTFDIVPAAIKTDFINPAQGYSQASASFKIGDVNVGPVVKQNWGGDFQLYAQASLNNANSKEPTPLDINTPAADFKVQQRLSIAFDKLVEAGDPKALAATAEAEKAGKPVDKAAVMMVILTEKAKESPAAETDNKPVAPLASPDAKPAVDKNKPGATR